MLILSNSESYLIQEEINSLRKELRHFEDNTNEEIQKLNTRMQYLVCFVSIASPTILEFLFTVI